MIQRIVDMFGNDPLDGFQLDYPGWKSILLDDDSEWIAWRPTWREWVVWMRRTTQ
jgi:hypothetical protein